MKKTILIVLLFFIAGLASANAAQSRESLSLALVGLKSLHIDCGAGYLKVQGVDGLEQIEVTAVITVSGIADSELAAFKKKYIVLKLGKVADQAELIAKVDSEHSMDNLFDGRDVSINLDIRLPRQLALDIDDGSGDIKISDCGASMKLEDGSGDIRLTNIQGHVAIEDGSGEIVLAKINGQLQIEDGSGDIDLDGAGNDVEIDDGSGQINLKGILGSVVIDDGSGDIVIDGVEKDVTIDESGSGAVKIYNVKGKVRQ